MPPAVILNEFYERGCQETFFSHDRSRRNSPAFMSSTAATAMFIPVILAITARTGLNRKRMLMPLAVAATIGGMMTLISSLPNMIVVNVLNARGRPPLKFFSVTPFSLSVLAAGIPFMLLGRGLLSRQQTGAAYNLVFRDWLPAQAQYLASHPNNLEATAKFVTVYHIVVENALFLTGMRYQLEGCRRWGRTWGFYKGFTAATRDESRHVPFGVKGLQDLVRQDPERMAPLIAETVTEFAPLIEPIMQPPGKNLDCYGGSHMESAWPGYTPESLRQEMIGYADNALTKRLHAIGIEVGV